MFIREKFELDFLYDWTQANRVSQTHTSSVNKLQIELKLNREVNASQLMNQDIGSIFQKGGGGGGPTTAVAEKRSKFVAAPSDKNTTNAGFEAPTVAATRKQADDHEESSSSKQKNPLKQSDENLIPNQDNTSSDKQIKRDSQAGGGIKIPIPPPDGKKAGTNAPL